ncbi:DUF4395 domain-containing protein [Paenibacillus tarimensis]
MVHPFSKSYDCEDEIPYHRVRANQIGILLCILIAAATQFLWIMALALAVQLVTRWFGMKYNPFVRLIAPMLPASSKTESRVLLRFNNLLAILFMIGTLTAFAFGAAIAAYIILAMLSAAVILALSGFCVGCFVYYQWKQFRARRSNG